MEERLVFSIFNAISSKRNIVESDMPILSQVHFIPAILLDIASGNWPMSNNKIYTPFDIAATLEGVVWVRVQVRV